MYNSSHMSIKNGLLSFIFLLSSVDLQAFPSVGRTQILPEGRKAIYFSQMNFSSPGEYDAFGRFSTFNVNSTLNLKDFSSASPKAQKVIDELESVHPGISNNLNFGSFHISPKVTAKAQILGLGWGLSSRLMLGVGVPIINATVTLKGHYKPSNSLVIAAKKLRQQSSTAPEDVKQKLSLIAQILEKAPQITPEIMHNYLVNEMGYKPIGSWHGVGFGDARLFLHYNYLLSLKARHALRWGVDVPIGRVDDPDILTDFAFGTGSYATNIETIHDFPLLGPLLTVSASASYKHYFLSRQTIRLTSDAPLAEDKETVVFKKGPITEVLLGVSSELLKNTEFFTQILHTETQKDNYSGKKQDFNYAQLSRNSNYQSQTVTYGLTYSTIKDFLNGSFLLPLKFTLSNSDLISGLSTEKVQYTQFDLQLFF